MRKTYEPNPIIIDRAVELWKRALAAPEYRNAVPGTRDHAEMAIAMSMAASSPKNNTNDVLDAFCASLKKRLMEKCTSERDPDYTFYVRNLAVDYHPDQVLAAAAKDAGLKMEFPYKTGMHLYEDCVSFSVGYGTPDQYHYPLADGRWLTTDMRGDDVAKVVAHIDSGTPLGLTIEPASPKAEKHMTESTLISIDDAAAAGIERLRSPIWAGQLDHFKLDIIDGKAGPWTHLFAPFNMECNGCDPIDVLFTQMDYQAKVYVPYVGAAPDSDEYKAAQAAFNGVLGGQR